MADFIGSTSFRNLLADDAAGHYYWATLHGAAGSGLVDGVTYTDGCHGELTEANGYLRGTETVDYTHVTSDGLLTAANASWTAAGGDIGPASYAAVWVSATNNILTAKLLWTDDLSATPQTATDGNDMTLTIGQNITIPTPA